MPKLGTYADHPLPQEWSEILDGLSPLKYRPVGRRIASLGHLVDACLALLPAERQGMIWDRLGPEKTLQQIGDEYAVTRERVRQVVNKAARLFFKDERLRTVLDGVFFGLSSQGPLLVNVQGAQSQLAPQGKPSQIWNFLMNLWTGVQQRPAESYQVTEYVFLFAPDGLPSEKSVRELMHSRASFLSAAQMAAALDIHISEAEPLALAVPQLFRTQNGLYGLRSWTKPQAIKAVAEQLAEGGVTEWHFSEIGKAVAFVGLEQTSIPPRNAAAILSRGDTEWFEQAGRKGFWRLRTRGDGHADNISAVKAVLADRSLPLHWTEIQSQLQRQVSAGTLIALLGRDPDFSSYGRGVFGLRGQVYRSTEVEDEFMSRLFAERGQDALDAAFVFERTLQCGLLPRTLTTVGRFSPVFRYWKWGTGEALFLTAEAANRRLFNRWFAARAEREIPSADVLTDGLVEAHRTGSSEVAGQTVQWLAHNAVALPDLPDEVLHWLEVIKSQ